MPILSGVQQPLRVIPRNLKTRLAKLIQRRFVWIVPLRPKTPGERKRLPSWVREVFAHDPHITETVLADVELALRRTENAPTSEDALWPWLKCVAYRITREHAFAEAPHLAALESPPEQQFDAPDRNDDPPELDEDPASSRPTPSEIVEMRELLAHALAAWGDSERDHNLLRTLLSENEDGNEGKQEGAQGAACRRRNLAYRRQRVRESVDFSLDYAVKRAA
ncbi:MAG: hypothetical protein EPO40_05715 [Myxococcaceae bacterium]|nr:MAG: hypothetical protein EPO40_05715 [Myxococcaceae bacterium]